MHYVVTFSRPFLMVKHVDANNREEAIAKAERASTNQQFSDWTPDSKKGMHLVSAKGIKPLTADQTDLARYLTAESGLNMHQLLDFLDQYCKEEEERHYQRMRPICVNFDELPF